MLGVYLRNVHEKAPLIHNITNYVTVNDVANVILACGGSPIMSDEPEEAADITSICAGLNINIGTPNKRSIKSMFIAGRKANELKHSVLLDPVGAGAGRLRTDIAKRLMDVLRIDVIRGNISEVKNLALGTSAARGVDASETDAVNENNLEDMIRFVKDFSAKSGSVIAVTGVVDLVADDKTCYVIRNGLPMMSKITGAGCQLSGMMSAFIAANPDNSLNAAAAAVCAFGLAGENGWKNMLPSDGNSTFRNRIIDAVFNMDEEILNKGAKYEVR